MQALLAYSCSGAGEPPPGSEAANFSLPSVLPDNTKHVILVLTSNSLHMKSTSDTVTIERQTSA